MPKSSYTQLLGFPIGKLLVSNLEYWRNSVLKHDWDCIGVVDGPEGSGKSVMAQQVGAFLDKNHKIKPSQVVFTPEGFRKAVLDAEAGKVVIWDEARGGLNRRRAMSATNNAITDMLAEIRQKNLFIIMVLPTFYDLDKNVALWRSRWLIHVFVKAEPETKTLKRGFYRFYSRKSMTLMYCKAEYSRFYAYPARLGAFTSSFKNHYVVPEEEYRRAKLAALRAYTPDDEAGVGPTEEEIQKAIKKVVHK